MSNYSTPVRVPSKHTNHKELYAQKTPKSKLPSSSSSFSSSPFKKSKVKDEDNNTTSFSKRSTVKEELINLEDDDDEIELLDSDDDDDDIDPEEEGDDPTKHQWKPLTVPTAEEMEEWENSFTDLDRIERKIDYAELCLRPDLPREKDMEAVVDDKDLVSEALLHQLIPKLYVMTEGDRELIIKNDLKVQQGRFSKVENAYLQRNWLRFLQDYIVPDPLLLFGFFKRGENRSLKLYYHAFGLRTKLLLRLGLDLPNRTLYQIYCRSRVFLSGLKKAKDFSEEDRDTILSGHRVHGDQYSKFCEAHGFNPKAAREVVRNTIKPSGVKLNSGLWTNEEMGQLKENVLKIMKKHKLAGYDGIPWSEVAADMKRSDVQCRQRFFSKVMFMMVQTKTDMEVWDDKFDMARLIALMAKCNWSDETMIDWDFIKEKFSIECFNILSRSWRVARNVIPDYNTKTLTEVLDYLYQLKVTKPYSRNSRKLAEIEAFATEAVKDL